MAEDLVDIVVLGASGFTGKYVLRELLKFRNPAGREPRKIAIAGRSKKKLAAALTWAAATAASTSAGRTVTKDLESSFSDDGAPPVVIYEADITNVASLRAVCKKTKVLVSCVGPYRKYGRPVVEACVEAGVDYLDITGEPEFMERMELLYHEKAKQTGKSSFCLKRLFLFPFLLFLFIVCIVTSSGFLASDLSPGVEQIKKLGFDV